MKHMRKDAALALFYGIVRVLEGPNDGFVSIESAKWGDFKGVYAGERGRGISHSIATGGRPVSADLHRTGDISEFYVRIVSELKNMGF